MSCGVVATVLTDGLCQPKGALAIVPYIEHLRRVGSVACEQLSIEPGHVRLREGNNGRRKANDSNIEEALAPSIPELEGDQVYPCPYQVLRDMKAELVWVRTVLIQNTLGVNRTLNEGCAVEKRANIIVRGYQYLDVGRVQWKRDLSAH